MAENSGNSLRGRAYRGKDGAIHHHTKTYMRQHGADGTGGRASSATREKSRGRARTEPAQTGPRLVGLFVLTLRDIYHGEKQILRALPKMARKASSQALKQAFETHREETLRQVERLEQIFEKLGERARGKPCRAIEGLLAEGKEIMDEVQDAEVLDAGLIAAAQGVEHYEIARYGTLAAWAKELGRTEIAELLSQTLAEEEKTDELLSELALSKVNERAG